jgi:hypothetical protein
LIFYSSSFKNDDLENCPLFIFGDFNFRVNTMGVLDLLRKEAAEEELKTSGGGTNNENQASQLVLGPKQFVVDRHEERFKHDWSWVCGIRTLI